MRFKTILIIPLIVLTAVHAFAQAKGGEDLAGRVGREIPPPPRQTGRADFPHPAFLKTLALGMHSYEPNLFTNRSTPSAQIAHRRSFLWADAMDADCGETDDNKAAAACMRLFPGRPCVDIHA